MCQEEMPERLALNKLKQLIGQFSIGLPYSAALRAEVQHSIDIALARELLRRFFVPHLEAAASRRIEEPVLV
jgi:hypothetical protein